MSQNAHSNDFLYERYFLAEDVLNLFGTLLKMPNEEGLPLLYNDLDIRKYS